MILPKQYSQRIFKSSFLTLISVATSIHFKLYNFTLVTTSVFLTSVNYWRRPVYGWRRNIDIFTSVSGCIYQTLHVRSNRLYFVCIALGILCYLCALVTKNKNYSSAWHCGIHVFGNTANILLYMNAKPESCSVDSTGSSVGLRITT